MFGKFKENKNKHQVQKNIIWCAWYIVIANSKFLNLESNLCLNTFEWMHIQSCQFLHFSKNWFMQVFEICNLFRKVRRRRTFLLFVWVDFLKNPLASQLPTYFHTSSLNWRSLSSKLPLKKKTVFKKKMYNPTIILQIDIFEFFETVS